MLKSTTTSIRIFSRYLMKPDTRLNQAAAATTGVGNEKSVEDVQLFLLMRAVRGAMRLLGLDYKGNPSDKNPTPEIPTPKEVIQKLSKEAIQKLSEEVIQKLSEGLLKSKIKNDRHFSAEIHYGIAELSKAIGKPNEAMSHYFNAANLWQKGEHIEYDLAAQAYSKAGDVANNNNKSHEASISYNNEGVVRLSYADTQYKLNNFKLAHEAYTLAAAAFFAASGFDKHWANCKCLSLISRTIYDLQDPRQAILETKEPEIYSIVMSAACALAGAIAFGIIKAKEPKATPLIPRVAVAESKVSEILRTILTGKSPSGISFSHIWVFTLRSYALYDPANPVIPSLIGSAITTIASSLLQEKVQKIQEQRLVVEAEKSALDAFLSSSIAAEVERKIAEIWLQKKYSDLTSGHILRAINLVSPPSIQANNTSKAPVQPLATHLVEEFMGSKRNVIAKIESSRQK